MKKFKTYYSKLLLKAISILTSISLILCFIGNLSPITYASTEIFQGKGTVDDPYLISNKYQLNNVRNYLDAHFKLVNDIVFDDSDFEEGGPFYNNGNTWEPIGTKDAPFTGSFDGDGYVIKRLKIKKTCTETEYIGLFGYYRNVNNEDYCIKNLFLSNSSIDIVASNDADIYVGSIVGFTYQDIANCGNRLNINVTSNTGVSYIGGIAGLLDGTSKIISCYNSGDIEINTTRGVNYVGGLIGKSDYKASIFMSYNLGNLIANSGEAYIGGICGYCSMNIFNCFNAGSVSSKASGYLGGIAGELKYAFIGGDQSKIARCYNIGELNKTSGYKSNIAYYGWSWGGYYMQPEYACYHPNMSNITYEELTLQETYKEFDFDEIWVMSTSPEYPYPLLRDNLTLFVNLGDIHENGMINGKDINFMRQLISGAMVPTVIQEKAADVNRDGLINGNDANLLCRFVAGSIVSFN